MRHIMTGPDFGLPFPSSGKIGARSPGPGGNADLITAVEKKRILVTRIRGQAVARLKAYGEGSQAWNDAGTLDQYLDVCCVTAATSLLADCVRD